MLEQKLDKISQENQNQVVNIKISDVYPNGDQPRIYFDEDKIIALCESIKKHGVLQPIVVRPDDEGRYMIIAGERRYRASIMANKESIPAIIKDMPIKEVFNLPHYRCFRKNLHAAKVFGACQMCCELCVK